MFYLVYKKKTDKIFIKGWKYFKGCISNFNNRHKIIKFIFQIFGPNEDPNSFALFLDECEICQIFQISWLLGRLSIRFCHWFSRLMINHKVYWNLALSPVGNIYLPATHSNQNSFQWSSYGIKSHFQIISHNFAYERSYLACSLDCLCQAAL